MSRLTEQNSFVRVNSLSLLRGNAVKVWNFPPRTGGWLPNLRFAVSRTWAYLSTLVFAAGFWVRGEKPSILPLWDNAAAKSLVFNSRTFLAALTNDTRRTARKTCHNAANFFFFFEHNSKCAGHKNQSPATRFDWPTYINSTSVWRYTIKPPDSFRSHVIGFNRLQICIQILQMAIELFLNQYVICFGLGEAAHTRSLQLFATLGAA